MSSRAAQTTASSAMHRATMRDPEMLRLLIEDKRQLRDTMAKAVENLEQRLEEVLRERAENHA